MPNLPSDGLNKPFKAIAGRNVRTPAQEHQPKSPLRPKKPKKLMGSVADIAKQRVKDAGIYGPQKAQRSDKERKDANQKLIDEAKKRFKRCAEAENDIREVALDDLKFRIGDQWPAEVLKQRSDDGRPCLTFNQMPQFCRQVTNDQRQNRPAITIHPVDDDADIDTAEIIQGIIRHIEYDSGAESAYDTGFQCAVDRSFGCWYIETDYSDVMSFEQDIKIRRVLNPFLVYIDPDAKEADRSDMDFAFMLEDYSRDAFEKKFPGAELSQIVDWSSVGDQTHGWVKENSVRVARYYYRERKKKKISLLSDGSVVPDDVLKQAFPDGKLPEGITVLRERETEDITVHICTINGYEVLEETEWPGTLIPVVMVLGDELNVDGELVLESLIRHSKDAQRQYNYFATATTETIALAPRAPYIGYAGTFAGFEKRWQTANSKNHPYLEANPVTVDGKAAPLPQRQTFEPAIQATTEAMLQSAEQLRSTTGIYQAALGQPSDEKSGIAIRNRQSQSQLGNFHFSDNLKRAIAYTGRVILEVIPHVYDTPRIVRITHIDGKQSTAQIGSVPQEQAEANAALSKVERIYDLSVGKYDVVVDAGPGYQTKREQAVDTQLQLVQANPQILPLIGDILVGNMDIPQAQKIAKRLHTMLPPQLQDDDEGGQQQIPPQVQQMMAQLHEQNQQLTQHLHATLDDLENKTTEKKMQLDHDTEMKMADIAVKEREQNIKLLQIQADLAMAESKANAELSSEMASREYDLISSELDRHHEAALSVMDHQHGLEAAEQSHQQGLEASQQQADNAAASQQSDQEFQANQQQSQQGAE